jgi:hypothetical protein
VILKPFINQLHDDESALGYIQQDGPTAHSATTTIAMLRVFFDDRLIVEIQKISGLQGLVIFYACEFFLWPHLKN